MLIIAAMRYAPADTNIAFANIYISFASFLIIRFQRFVAGLFHISPSGIYSCLILLEHDDDAHIDFSF